MKPRLLLFLAASLPAVARAEPGTATPASPPPVAASVPAVAAAKATAPSDDAELKPILASIDQSMFPSNAVASMRMMDYKKNQKTGESALNKTLEMDLHTSQNNALIEMRFPAVDRGKYILKTDQGLWLFQSKIKRSIRISARDDFNGTSASNYDILEINLIRDYDVGAHSRETLDGRELLKVQLTARPGTQGYEKIVSWIDPKEGSIVRNDCYAISGVLIKTITYHDRRPVAQYRVPTLVKVASAIRPGSYSTIEFTKIEAASTVPEHYFSLGYLESLN